jgi:hypothetical protein
MAGVSGRPNISARPRRAKEPHLLDHTRTQGQHPQAVLDLRPHSDEAVTVAQQPQHLAALQRRQSHPRELPPHQRIEDEFSVTPVVLLLAPGAAADFDRIAEPHPVAETRRQLLEPGAVAAGLQPDNDLAGEPGIEAAEVVTLVMKLPVVYLAVRRVTVADRVLTRVEVHPTIDRHRHLLVRSHARPESIAAHA